MPTVLVTGANRGIGLEFARQYREAGWTVIGTCRRPESAPQLAGLGAEVHALDVADGEAIRGLAHRLGERSIDVLINNAGVYGGDQSLGALDGREWQAVLLVDAVAPIRMAEAFVGHLARAPRPVIANITSKMGSIDDNGSGGVYMYRSAKAALNAATRSLAIDLRGRGVLVALLHPGWVQTDMGGPGALITARQSVEGMRAIIARLTPPDSGRFLAYDGKDIPW